MDSNRIQLIVTSVVLVILVVVLLNYQQYTSANTTVYRWQNVHDGLRVEYVPRDRSGEVFVQGPFVQGPPLWKLESPAQPVVTPTPGMPTPLPASMPAPVGFPLGYMADAWVEVPTPDEVLRTGQFNASRSSEAGLVDLILNAPVDDVWQEHRRKAIEGLAARSSHSDPRTHQLLTEFIFNPRAEIRLPAKRGLATRLGLTYENDDELDRRLLDDVKQKAARGEIPDLKPLR